MRRKGRKLPEGKGIVSGRDDNAFIIVIGEVKIAAKVMAAGIHTDCCAHKESSCHVMRLVCAVKEDCIMKTGMKSSRDDIDLFQVFLSGACVFLRQWVQ